MAQSSSTDIPILGFSIGILISTLPRNASTKRPRAQKVSMMEVGVDSASMLSHQLGPLTDPPICWERARE